MSVEKDFGFCLKKLRNEKGLTIRQLEKQTGVSNAYLSQLENGKRGIPSPDILKKIHSPLGVSYDELMEKAGYISEALKSELHPQTIETIESNEEFELFICNAADIFLGSITDNNGRIKEEYREFILREAKELSMGTDEINILMDDPDISQKVLDNFTIGEKITFINLMIKDFVERGIDPKEIFKNSSTNGSTSNSMPVVRVPVLGCIAAGLPILAEEHIEEWAEIQNRWNLKEGEAFILKVKGDSMIGSRIYEGDRILVRIQPFVENGQIAVVNVNGDEATLKRVKRTENGQVILYPDNPRYDPIFITDEGARIIGKVIQVMFEPQ